VRRGKAESKSRKKPNATARNRDIKGSTEKREGKQPNMTADFREWRDRGVVEECRGVFVFVAGMLLDLTV
jgi:hypothetical protein